MSEKTTRLMNFEELGLGSLLKRYKLEVPKNQRDYAWTDREVGQLLSDFTKAINEATSYFLGTIVTIPRGEDLLEVVDGQQRLATTVVVLAAIREHLRGLHEDMLVDSIDNEFLSKIDRERRVRVPNLKLNVDDNDIFHTIVTMTPGDPLPAATRASHERLLKAREIAQKHISRVVASFDAGHQGDILNAWLSFIEHSALVVLLRVPDDADAYKMFETLNDRGLRTSQADLIKNFLFGRSGTRMAEVQTKWSYMRGALEAASDDPDITINFLRHALIVQNGHLTAAEVYQAVQAMVKSEVSAVSFAATIENLANVYVATMNPEHERWNSYPDSVRRAIEVFNLFDIKPMRPLILSVGEKMEPKEAALAYRFLIALSVRLMIASSTRSGSVEEPLADVAHTVWSEKVTTAAALRDSLAVITPTDSMFQTAFETARVSNAKLARYFLRSLEMTAKGEAEPWFMPQQDTQVINLEHVLPKKPEENWPQFNDDAVRLLTTRLGNLALMRASDNSKIRSQEFAAKRDVYADSPYELTRMIAQAEKWTAETIDDRQQTLADLAVKTWSLKV